MRTTPVLLLAMCLPGAGAKLPTATAALGDVTLETALSFGIPMAVGAVVTALDSFAMVTQGNAGLVERLGKYDRTLRPGLHLKLPFVERLSCYVRALRVLDVPAQRCITMDNAPLTADAVVFYRIRDLTQAKYRIDDYAVGLSNLILTQLRSEIGQLSLDQTFTAREKLNQILLREANAVTTNWGIDVVRVEIAANLALATSANAKVVVQGGGGGGRTTDAALYGTTLGLAHDGVEAVPPA
ncbi:hypothetical protein JL720_2356 [Aureococcus anophagefferens]|nr:hypothetical protein JL720_2356 [Aureococcus anophagefferens]